MAAIAAGLAACGAGMVSTLGAGETGKACDCEPGMIDPGLPRSMAIAVALSQPAPQMPKRAAPQVRKKSGERLQAAYPAFRGALRPSAPATGKDASEAAVWVRKRFVGVTVSIGERHSTL